MTRHTTAGHSAASGGPPAPNRPARTGVRAGALLALLLIAAVWGCTFSMVKEALDTVPPLTFVAVRFLMASALLAPGLLLRGDRRGGCRSHGRPSAAAPVTQATAAPETPPVGSPASGLVRDLWAGAPVGVWLCLGYALQTLGLRWTGAAEAAFITGTSVVIVPSLSPWLAGRRTPAATWAGVAVTAGGLALLTLGGTAGARGVGPAAATAPATSATGRFGAFTPLAGDFLVLLCALAFALQILAVGRRAARCRLLPFTLGQTLATAVLCGAMALCLERRQWGPPSPGACLALGVTAVLATAVALVVQVVAQRVATPTEAALVFATEPVFAAAFAWVYAGEVLGPLGLVGAALILAGTLWAELASGRGASGPPRALAEER